MFFPPCRARYPFLQAPTHGLFRATSKVHRIVFHITKIVLVVLLTSETKTIVLVFLHSTLIGFLFFFRGCKLTWNKLAPPTYRKTSEAFSEKCSETFAVVVIIMSIAK